MDSLHSHPLRLLNLPSATTMEVHKASHLAMPTEEEINRHRTREEVMDCSMPSRLSRPKDDTEIASVIIENAYETLTFN